MKGSVGAGDGDVEVRALEGEIPREEGVEEGMDVREDSALLSGNRMRASGKFVLLLVEVLALFAGVTIMLNMLFPMYRSRVTASVGEGNETVVLVSIDGFRWNYLDLKDDRGKPLTPTLLDLRERGIAASKMEPVMPSKTFPNHWSIITGLFPAWHGIIDNNMYDRTDGSRFSPENHKDPKWWEGEPLWTTLQRSGLTAATVMWPGSEVKSSHHSQPDAFQSYDGEMAYEKRVDLVLKRLKGKGLPQGRKPSLVTLYLNWVDEAGHAHGPNSPQVREQIINADNAIKRLVEAVEADAELKSRTSFVIVSDHGMHEQKREDAVILDAYVDTEGMEIPSTYPLGQFFGSLSSKLGAEDIYEEVRKIGSLDGLEAMRVENSPTRWHYVHTLHTAPVITLTEPGISLLTNKSFEIHPELWGDHGFDNQADSMQAIFIAYGNAFRSSPTLIDGIRAVDVYITICTALGVPPSPHNGSTNIANQLVKNRSSR